MRHFIFAAASALFCASGAFAQCMGSNLYDALPAPDQQALKQAAEAVPYPSGNFWRAEKDGQSLTLIGTYHMDDPRHEAALIFASPLISEADLLLVEAGPEEEAALIKDLSTDPNLMFIAQGPTLLERLPRETWEKLSRAMKERGIPGPLAAKMQPWYATMVLGIAPCIMAAGLEPEGLDGLLIEAAEKTQTPIAALEPHDTVFSIFAGLTPEEEIDLITSTLAMEERSEDFAVTLADLYFRGESRLIWELMRKVSYELPEMTEAEVDAEMAMMEARMMENRNRAWIPVIEAAAAQGRPVVAFGALHLSGKAGVLALLEEKGWSLSPLKP